jgi:hypothetical protein
MANMYWYIFCNFGVHSLRSQFGNMAPPNQPEITMNPSVLEDFFAFKAYKAAWDALEAASAATGPGGGGEVVSMPKATSAPKKKNPRPANYPSAMQRVKCWLARGRKERRLTPHLSRRQTVVGRDLQ